MPFKPVGKIEKDHAALRVDLPSWKLGQLVIGAADVSKLLTGDEATVSFVQQRGEAVFVGYAGTARISKNGKAVNVKIEARMMTVPAKALRAVVEGKRTAAQISALAPVIDADGRQREAIDRDLVRSFV